jgi:4-aminobutyrate aminotransferase / (S)-3-amino-2-methylpropionate transaminase / 5-aminovalerate transaminase
MTGNINPGDGDLLPHLVTTPPGPASLDLARRLAQVESRNVTFRSDEFPVFWTSARGSNVRDADGNLYVDMTAAFGVASAGHQHPAIVEAVRRQAGQLSHGMGDVHPPALKVELLERLAGMAPWKSSRAVLASSGSEAVEIALKTAQLATGHEGVIAFEGGYHGLTLGALSVTSREDFRGPFSSRVSRHVDFVPFPDPMRAPSWSAPRSLEALEEAFSAARDRGRPAGSVIVEPIQGRGGVRIPPAGFLAEVARLTREAGAVLIFDEIFTGLGRTGSTFALEEVGATPDILCLGKALGGGLPISACLGSEAVMKAWPLSTGEALHTSTFLGHPLSCASSLAFLDVLKEEELVSRAWSEGRHFLTLLEEQLGGMSHVGQVRGRGLFIGVELVRPSSSTSESRPEPWAGAGARVAVEALRRGLLVLPAGESSEIVELTPPLTTARHQMDWAAETLGELIADMGGEDGPSEKTDD